MKDFAKIIGVALLFSLVLVVLSVSFSPRTEIGFDPSTHSVNVTDNASKPNSGLPKK